MNVLLGIVVVSFFFLCLIGLLALINEGRLKASHLGGQEEELSSRPAREKVEAYFKKNCHCSQHGPTRCAETNNELRRPWRP